MEKIEKKREVVTTTTDILYKAIDGTMFSNEDECRRYEETSEAILLGRLADIQIKEVCCDDLFESSGEGVYRVVVPRVEEDINALLVNSAISPSSRSKKKYSSELYTLNQLWKLNGGASSKDFLFFDKGDLQKVILVGIRFATNDKIDWIWFWKFNDVINNITDGKYVLARRSLDNDR